VSQARARDPGIVCGTRPTGAGNAITDLPGVRVGHTTLVEGSDIRTGVTAIVPDAFADAGGCPISAAAPSPSGTSWPRWTGAAPGPVAEGAVGAGTGTSALGFKAGIGTSSRLVDRGAAGPPVTIGVLVQANFGGTLTVLGVPVPPDPGSEPDHSQLAVHGGDHHRVPRARQARRAA